MKDIFLFVTIFFTIPTLLAILAELYSLSSKKDSEDISFWTWTFTNPAGVVLLPLFFYFITLLSHVNWKIEDLTKINISASLAVPIVFSGILAINSYIFNLTQESTKVSIKDSIIAEMRVMQAEFKAAAQKQRAEDKAASEKKLDEDKAMYNQLLKDIGKDVNQLNIDKAVREALSTRS